MISVTFCHGCTAELFINKKLKFTRCLIIFNLYFYLGGCWQKKQCNEQEGRKYVTFFTIFYPYSGVSFLPVSVSLLLSPHSLSIYLSICLSLYLSLCLSLSLSISLCLCLCLCLSLSLSQSFRIIKVSVLSRNGN